MNMKKLFEQSMWDLLEKKSIKNITVGMIVDAVGSCKGTFYKYYLDKFDLCCSCLKDRIYNYIHIGTADFDGVCLSCLELFKQNETVMRHSFDSDEVNSARHYHEELSARFISDVVYGSGAEISESVGKICIDSFASVSTSIIFDWLFRGCNEEISEVMSYIRAVAPHFIYDLVYGSGKGASLDAAGLLPAGKARIRRVKAEADGPITAEWARGAVTVTVKYASYGNVDRAISVDYTVAI